MVEPALKYEEPIKEEKRLTNAEKAFDENLKEHSVDKIPEVRGRKDLIAKLRGNTFACENALVERCSPPIEIEKIVLEPGKSVVLIGPNGSGKSTIFDAIMEIKDAHVDTSAGKGALVYGRPVHAREAMRISRLNQEEILEPIQELTAQEALDIAEEKFKEEFEVDWSDPDLVEENIKNEDAQQRIERLRGQIVKLFKMEEFLNTPVKNLSGGERTKLTLFMVLLSEPDVLLLDEPTNHLDLESIAKLSGLFKVYQKAGISILSVSHVNWFLEEAGSNGVTEIQADKSARKVNFSNSPFKKYIKDRSRSGFTIVEGDVEWKSADGVRSGSLITPARDKSSILDSPLQNFEIDTLNGGDVWVLSGNNGTGKTKLMEAMARRKKGREIFKRGKGVNVAYLPQFWPKEIAEGTLEDFFYWIKDGINPHSELVAKNLSDEARKIGFSSRGKSERIDRSWLKSKLDSFSGGEQRLLWFLTASRFVEIDILMLDEPTNHMDKNLQEFVTRAIQNFQGAIVLSTHDIKLLDTISKSVGKKIGSTITARNFILEKVKGKTTISPSQKSPAQYMKQKLEAAKKEAKRTKIA